MSIQYNLQFFAKEGMGGEKTEEATAKKLQDARKEGQVARSKEIGNGFGLITLFLVLKLFIGFIGSNLLEIFNTIYLKIPEYTTLINGRISIDDFMILLRTTLMELVIIVSPIFGIGFLVLFIVELVQVKWKPTQKPLMPKLNKLNPISGVKKVISLQSLVELVKSFLKIGLIIFVVYTTLINEIGVLFTFYRLTVPQSIAIIGDIAITLGLKVSLIYMIIAVGDYIFQKWKFGKDMRMSKQEVKEEYKNAEGNPEVKGKIRQKMREVSRRRMMADLPKADVVITNPTHYAVAIKYDPHIAAAPIVLAKGEDHLALKIKEIAKENKIEIVENKPLARMLYANVEIGEQIPEELFQAVAEILSVIYNMQGKKHETP
ncbi:MAG: flagellar biosynthesis protein FlhB [Eubacteriales bacterium]